MNTNNKPNTTIFVTSDDLDCAKAYNGLGFYLRQDSEYKNAYLAYRLGSEAPELPHPYGEDEGYTVSYVWLSFGQLKKIADLNAASINFRVVKFWPGNRGRIMRTDN